MNFQRGRSREDPEINLIPLIDVLLVILIFLMITTTYSRYAELSINLPQAQGDRAKEVPNMLSVAVDADGRYSIDERIVIFSTIEALSDDLKRAAKGNPDPVIAIGADAAATHQSVVNIMAAARQAGFTHITFTTQSKPAE